MRPKMRRRRDLLLPYVLNVDLLSRFMVVISPRLFRNDSDAAGSYLRGGRDLNAPSLRLFLHSPYPLLTLGSITHQQQQQELPTHTREERLLSPLCRHWSWSRPYLMGEGERAALALASNDVFLITMIAIRGWQRQ